MPFCRATLSAKRFIAGVGGRTPASPPTRAEQRRSSGGGAFLELADDALSDIAHRIDRADHLLLADHDFVEQAFELRCQPGSTSAGSACLRTPNSDSPVSVGTMFFPWAMRNPASSARR